MNGLEIKSPDFTRVIENDSLWTDLLSNRNLPPFSDEAVAFVSALSTSILALEQIREQPELVALAFWLRRSNIQKMIADYNRDSKQNVYPLARGVVLHIAPSNVDTIFVYSWILSLLCGNRNILRVPSRSTPQINILLGCINGVLSKTEFREIRDRVSFLRYEASEDATSILSNQVDMRIIWGGDETVNRIRRIPIPPTALDISFANKWSLSVINYEHWVQLPPNQKLELARSFALDAFQFGQAACSSPRCVVWLNENNLHLDVESFWGNVTEVLSTVPFDFSAVDFVNKLVESDLLAQEKLTMKVVTSDNRITRLAIEADHLHKIVESIHQCDAGFFFECSTNTLEGMFLKLDRKLQTVASAGVSSERWRELFEREQLQCFDRIVPIGSALDFSPTWDGFQLFNEFLRFVHIAPMK